MSSESELKALQWIYTNNGVTRADLIEVLGLSQATVVRLVTDLRSRGYLIERQTTGTSGRGRPSANLEINPNCGCVVGLEFGLDHLILVFAAANGTLIGWEQVKTPPPFSPSDNTMNQLADIVRAKAKAYGLDATKLRAVGLALHGIVSKNAEWLRWEHASESFYPVRSYLSEQLKCLVHVEDVSRAFAEAEHRYGAGKQRADMLYLFIGRNGIGSGIFVNNVLLNSSIGICGEIGHITVVRDGMLCQCGNRGCLETVATHDAIIARVIDRLTNPMMSVLKADNLSFSQICQAYRDGDKLAHIILRELAEHLATALSSTINIVGSTHVIIGGQLRSVGDDFLVTLTHLLRQQIIPSLAQRLNIGYAELPVYAGGHGVASQTLDAAWQTGNFLETKEIV